MTYDGFLIYSVVWVWWHAVNSCFLIIVTEKSAIFHPYVFISFSSDLIKKANMYKSLKWHHQMETQTRLWTFDKTPKLPKNIVLTPNEKSAWTNTNHFVSKKLFTDKETALKLCKQKKPELFSHVNSQCHRIRSDINSRSLSTSDVFWPTAKLLGLGGGSFWVESEKEASFVMMTYFFTDNNNTSIWTDLQYQQKGGKQNTG